MNEHRTHLVIVLEGAEQADVDRLLEHTGWTYGIEPFAAPAYAVALVESIGDHARKRAARLETAERAAAGGHPY